MVSISLRQSVFVRAIATAFFMFTAADRAFPRAEVEMQQECVILLHGLARSSRSMKKLQTVLEKRYWVVNQPYDSRKYPIEELAEKAISTALAECGERTKVHFVTHSLGGILLRQYLHHKQIHRLGKTIMLGPPNQGSELADKVAQSYLVSYFNGPAGSQLGTDPHSLPNKLGAVNFALGVIAGSKNYQPDFASVFPGAHDGKVSVARSKVDGMTDHLILPVGHTFMMNDKTVIQQVCHFLLHGKFNHQSP